MSVEFTPFYDSRGFPACVGDLIRVPHFRGKRNRQMFMYKILVEVPERRKGMVAMCLTEYIELGKDKAHICDMAVLGDFEIVDGHGGYDLPTWEHFTERPKRKERGGR